MDFLIICFCSTWLIVFLEQGQAKITVANESILECGHVRGKFMSISWCVGNEKVHGLVSIGVYYGQSSYSSTEACGIAVGSFYICDSSYVCLYEH